MTAAENLSYEYLRQRAHALSRALLFRLEEYTEDFPTGTPLELVDLFRSVVQEADKTIEATLDPDRLTLIGHTLNNTAEIAMSFLDNANSAQTPRGLAQLLQYTQDRLNANSLDVRSRLLVTPQDDYNYSIADYFPVLNNNLRDTLVPASAWDLLCSRYDQGLSVVRFPRVERENILLHAIFGHEFGHPIADDFLQNEQKTPEYQAQLTELNKQVGIIFAAPLAQTTDAIQRAKKQNQLVTIAVQMRRRGLEELISDAVAVHLFGMSALFAAAELLIPDGLDQPPVAKEFYPPSRYRLRVMCKVATDSGHLAAIKSLSLAAPLTEIKRVTVEHVEFVNALAQSVEDLAAIAGMPLVSIAYDWLKKSLPAGLSYAQNAAAQFAYGRSTVETEVPEALARLSMGIPPGDAGLFPNIRIIDCRTPILAGWMHKLYLLTCSELDWLSRRDSIHATQSQVLKGIEDALLRAEYAAIFTSAIGATKP